MTEWTISTLKEHFDALREADQRALEIKASGDARALAIKEAGDAKALDLARTIQEYKDEKDNKLREQINSERGLYATKAEIAPLTAYVLSQTGRGQGLTIAYTGAGFVIMLAVAILVPLLTK
jgi:hypothetical protein